MIRINLLGTPKSRRGSGGRRQAPVAASGGEGLNSVVLGLIAVALVGGGLLLWNLMLTKETEKLQKDLQVQLQENQKLAGVKQKYEESKRKKELFERRVKVIDELKDAQKGPVDLLNLVADTVNGSDAVWLETMTNDGRSIDFTGTALSPNAVADLMANLRRTGAFKSVEIKETSQDGSAKALQIFKFELICEIGKLESKEQKKTA
ncbi:MAG TPA: PilN domain-containing protein [Candidatus Angelobacter sp.]|nr:PilN domain-containing protein [Candidatus Angelobacter sp.]